MMPQLWDSCNLIDGINYSIVHCVNMTFIYQINNNMLVFIKINPWELIVPLVEFNTSAPLINLHLLALIHLHDKGGV